MVKFSMVTELRPTLRMLNRQPALWSVPGFLLAWEMVVLTPIASLLAPANEQGRELCRNQLKMLQNCPAAGELDLGKLARYDIQNFTFSYLCSLRELLRLDVKELTWQLLPFITEEEMGDPWDIVRGFKFKEEKVVISGAVPSLIKDESSPAL